jgi:hypothetical protein
MKPSKLLTPPTLAHWIMMFQSWAMGWGLVYRWDSLDAVPHHILMMWTEIVPETLVIFNKLKWLIAQDFINFSYCESFRS